MDLEEESSRFISLPTSTLQNLSSSSSVYFSANQSPFFSPRSPTCQLSESARSEIRRDSVDPVTISRIRESEFGINSSSTGVSSTPSSSNHDHGNCYFGQRERQKKAGRTESSSYPRNSVSLSSSRARYCDVFLGLHGNKRSLLRFANWLRAELEAQGMSCFASDRARCRSSRKHRTIEKAMDVSTFGVVILTKKSFRNPYTIEELRLFSKKKNLVPIYFDLGPGDCFARDIVERRGDLWGKHGGELWLVYGGLEKEWAEAINGLSRVDEWKLEAQEGNWRDCIFRAVTLLAMRLGRRSTVERLTKWREQAEKEEFPFSRKENFIGRKKELSDLEFILFGDVSGDSKKDYLELKARPKRKNLRSNPVGERKRECHQTEKGIQKGKELVIWKEFEKEIEMQNTEFSISERELPRAKLGGRYGRSAKSSKISYGKGIACVSGEPGIGKTELLLEFVYIHHQRYKMVLWIGGENRYIRQNYLNLWSFLEVDVGTENSPDKTRIRSFEEQEAIAISRVRRELMRNIPFLVVIDNFESEKDWWDHKLVMDLLPRFGGETHFIISTRLPRVLNLEPLKLTHLSGVEEMLLMQGSVKNHAVSEVDALGAIRKKLGRLTLGLAIVGAILTELPLSPSRLLDTINRMPLRDMSWCESKGHQLRRNTFLLQLFEVCFSIFDHAHGPQSLATRMVLASGWFAPAPIPVFLLALAARKIPKKHRPTRIWRKLLRSTICGLSSSYSKRSEAEASSMLLRFNLARSSSKQGCIRLNDLVKLYAHARGIKGVGKAVVHVIITHGSVSRHSEHLWAACFLLFKFGKDPVVVELKVTHLLVVVKEIALPLAIWTFTIFSRCGPALELLRLCTDALEAADQAFVTPVEKWLDKSLCWKPIQTNAQLNPCLWQELALTRATVLETRAKFMVRGGQFGIGDDLIRKAIFIRTSILGEDHQDTVSARETLSKITSLLANIQNIQSKRFQRVSVQF